MLFLDFSRAGCAVIRSILLIAGNFWFQTSILMVSSSLRERQIV
jgi:hypothetical protein